MGNNTDNLRVPTHEEAVELGRKGGIASGQAKRAKATLSTIARTIANAPAPDKARKKLEQLGIDTEDINGQALVVAGVYKRAIDGEERAVEKWEQWTDAITADEKPYELPARVLGRAYVDINRHIVPNKSYVFKGGRGSTKSSYISLKIIELIKNNPDIHACVVRKVAGTLKDSVFSQIKWAIHELGLDDEFHTKNSPLEIQYKKTGQTIYFRGCDDPVKLKSIKPPFGYIGILWIEERDQLDSAADERNIKQSTLRGGSISYDFASYNPPKSKDNWVNKELLIPDENRVVHSSTYLEVPEEWLGIKFLQDAEHLKATNYDAYEHEYLGVPNGIGGNVFENIEVREITDKEIQWMDHIYQGTDWGWFPDPFAFIRVHYDAKKEEIYFIDEIVNNKTSNEANANEIKRRGYDDAYITCDSAEHKSTADFRACGLPAKDAVKGVGSVDYGMKWLQTRKLIIDPKRTPYALKEFMEYEFEKNKDDDYKSGYPDANNHTIDALRYAMERESKKYWSKA